MERLKVLPIIMNFVMIGIRIKKSTSKERKILTMENLGSVMIATWYGFGLEIIKVNENNIINENGMVDEYKKELELYVSVPKSSYHKNANGEEMSGHFLAKRFKQCLSDMIDTKNKYSHYGKIVVKYKIRNEIWTKEKADLATKKKIEDLYWLY